MGIFVFDILISRFQDKSLLEYTNLFYHNEYKNHDKIILKYFQ